MCYYYYLRNHVLLIYFDKIIMCSTFFKCFFLIIYFGEGGGEVMGKGIIFSYFPFELLILTSCRFMQCMITDNYIVIIE